VIRYVPDPPWTLPVFCDAPERHAEPEHETCAGCARAREALSFWLQIDEAFSSAPQPSKRLSAWRASLVPPGRPRKLSTAERAKLRALLVSITSRDIEVEDAERTRQIEGRILQPDEPIVPLVRGRPSLKGADTLIRALAEFWKATGGPVESHGVPRLKMRTGCASTDPFGRFLAAIHVGLEAEFGTDSIASFHRRARKILAEQSGRKGAIILRNVSQTTLRGRMPDDFDVPAGEKGLPADLYWRKRLAAGEVKVVRPRRPQMSGS